MCDYERGAKMTGKASPMKGIKPLPMVDSGGEECDDDGDSCSGSGGGCIFSFKKDDNDLKTKEIAANCPNKLIFNSTNVATLALCTTLNYLCPSPNPNRTQFETYNNTTGPAPSTCRPYAWDLALDANATGTLTIAGVATASNVWFAGLGPGLSPYNASVVIPAVPLKVTALELPDLVNVKGSLSLSEADRMEKFSVPLLEEIGIEGVDIDLSGTDPPAIDLSFPSFRGSKGFISLVGNIDR
ncbi:uncharacterized protein LY89DRAFT_721085 [Mollisia scopiformis]|uniref:Uncharacterized protein n=1 Tax=Mollisia scopiformis TaxID=149040 RepID=A0A194X1P3_MOLSC|nr:uncharacterized protein LY89DRAFT_721085 [Mollisia scopiformis]KUJ13904.1 hypothetical protein LY89DRAFT_721085 [Mollisia scopiformis]